MIEIPRGPDDDGWHKSPLTWRLVKMSDGSYSATVGCVNGHSSLLDHDIASNGVVTPSLDCPEDNCDWHEMVRLLEWEPKYD